MKVCCRCRIEKKLTEFCKNRAVSSGYCGSCKICMYEYARKYKKNNRQKMYEYLKKWHKINPGKHKEYNLQQRKTNPNFKEFHKIRNQKYSKKKPEVNREKWARYYTKKMNAMPDWVDKEELLQVYRKCPKGMEVDHIVPLQGKVVSGLHVPWNLQYLSRSENASKGNKLCRM